MRLFRYFLLFTMVVALIGLGRSGPAMAADSWEDEDDTYNSDNFLHHTFPATQHDLEAQGGVGDEDWYQVRSVYLRSYEVQMMNVTGDINGMVSPTFQLCSDNSCSGTLPALLMYGSSFSASSNASYNKTLRWVEMAYSRNMYVRIAGNYLGTASAKYTIQLMDTTLQCPRWNDSATQTTVFLLQRADTGRDGQTACTGTVNFYNESGTLLLSQPFTLNNNDREGMTTASYAAVDGLSGSATISHDCGYGGIAAKAVAMEPATGYTFDTPCTYLPR